MQQPWQELTCCLPQQLCLKQDKWQCAEFIRTCYPNDILVSYLFVASWVRAAVQTRWRQLFEREFATRIISADQSFCAGAKSVASTWCAPTDMHSGRNSLQGSSTAAFRNWTRLTLLSMFENVELDFDLGILDSMPSLQNVLMQVKYAGRDCPHKCMLMVELLY